MNKTLTIFSFFLCLVSCSGGVGTEGSDPGSLTLTVIQGTASSERENYDQENNYCDHILFHKTEALVLIDYNFFPAGTDVCQQVTYDAELNPEGDCRTAKTVVLPCGFDGASAEGDDLLSVSISAPTGDGSCDGQLVIDLSAAEFTIDGLVFSFVSSLDVFANDLGFKITRDGIIKSSDGTILSFESKAFGLEEIVLEIQ